MTDARISERYLLDRRVARLSDSAFRAWVTATLWSVANRTDGHIDALDLPLIPRLDADAADDLVEAKLWTAVDGGWVIESFQDEQTSRSELQALDDARRHARERKRAQRERERNTPADAESRDGHVTNSVTSHGTTQDRTGLGSQSPTDTADEKKSVSPVALVTAREVSPAARSALGSDILANALGSAGWATLRDEIAEKSSETVRDREAYALRALTADDRAAWVVRAWDITGATPPRPAHAHRWAGDGTCIRPADDDQPCYERREASA